MQRDVSGRLRVRWYIHHKAFTSGAPQAHRLVCLVMMHPVYHTPSDLEYATSCMKLHTQLPFQVDDIHLLGASIVDWNQTSGASGSIVCRRCDWRLLQTFGPISQWRFPSRRHEFESVIERRQKWCVLIRGAGCCSNSSGCMDFATRTYPKCAGGHFTNVSFQKWLKRQRLHEHMVYSSEEYER